MVINSFKSYVLNKTMHYIKIYLNINEIILVNKAKKFNIDLLIILATSVVYFAYLRPVFSIIALNLVIGVDLIEYDLMG